MAVWMLYPLLFIAGFVDSIAGGGGLVSLGAYLACGLPPHLALGTNKFSACLGTGLSAVYFARKGHVEWRSALQALVGALLGSALGAKLALAVDERTLSWLLLVIIPAVALFVLWKKDLHFPERRYSPGKMAALAFATGLVVGCYDGFIGPGTGTFLILAFTAILGLGLLSACGNAKIVNFGSNISGVFMFMLADDVDYALGIPCALCCIAGNFVGTRMAIKNGARVVRPMMLIVVTLLLAKVLRDLLQ